MPQFFWKKSLIVQVVPPVPPEVVGVKTLGDIEFLSIKEFQAKLRFDEGFTSAVGDLATLTANTGKDMYIARAKIITFSNNTNAVSLNDEVVLKINGVIVETSKASPNFAANIFGPTYIYEFRNIGHKVLAGEIIKLEVITLDTDTDVEGFIECYEEDTGTSPQITGTGTGGGGGVGDIGFLAVKQFENKLRTDEGTLTGTGVLASITSNVGKDMYIAGASLTYVKNIGSGSFNVQVELQVNGIVVETYISRGSASSPGGFHPYHFNQRGIMVAAGETIELVVTALGSSSQIEGNILVWEEDTGESPGDIGGGTGGGSLRFGATETLFAPIERAADSVFMQEFDMTGALYAVIVQDSRIVDNSTRTVQGVPVGWINQDVLDSIDNNITNGLERNLNSSSEMRIDWGSIALRQVRTVFQLRTVSNNPANSIRFDMEFSDDDIVYANSQFIGSTGGLPNTVNINIDLTSQSFRFTKVVVTQANNTRGTMREIYAPALSGGASDLFFEAFDSERGDWKRIFLTTPLDTLRPIDTGATVVQTDQIGEGQDNRLIMPTATQTSMNLIRAVLTTTDDGVSSTSVVVIKTNTVV